MDARKQSFKVDVDSSKNSPLNGWINTGIIIDLNKNYKLNASGSVVINTNDPPLLYVGPEGDLSKRYQCQCGPFKCGELVARVGDTGEIIAVGRERVIKNKEGLLYLAVWDGWADNNSGAFEVNTLEER